jgi:hypothetical protein
MSTLVLDDDHIANKVVEKLTPTLQALIATAIAGVLVPTSAAPKYADAKNNPLGSPNAFLVAARRNDFATFRRKRRITAVWVDVESWLESRKRPSVVPASSLDGRALLEQSHAKKRPRRPLGGAAA